MSKPRKARFSFDIHDPVTWCGLVWGGVFVLASIDISKVNELMLLGAGVNGGIMTLFTDRPE